MDRKLGIGVLLALAVAATASCSREEMDVLSVDREGAITLSSFRQQVFTRADVDEIDFPAGTKYTLLAVDAAQPTKWSSAAGFENVPQEGVEAVTNGVHKISYEPVGLYRHGESLDFYGLLYNVPKDEEPAAAAPVLNTPIGDDVNPTITIGETDGLLPDLMHSNETKGKSSADGIVQLPFEHALAALNFIISKQDEQHDEVQDKQLQNVKVTKVVLKNVAKQATMDVATGVWTPEAASERVVFEDAAGKVLTTEAKAIGPKDMLVFPTYGEQVSVEVSLEGLEMYNGSSYVPMNKTFDATGLVVTDGKCTVSYDLKLFDDVTGDVAGNLQFERNHKYQLAIFVMRDNVRIVAVSPQVYEWVDVDLDLVSDPRVTTLGQPITIGGTVWMDRNLGAKSADCENDWLHTLGYYFEYARNIPFILDPEVFAAKYEIPDRYKDDNGKWVANTDQYVCYKNIAANGANAGKIVRGAAYDPGANGQGASVVAFPDYLIYTWDNKGRKVSKVETRTANRRNGYTDIHISAEALGKIVAVNPGDTGSYAFIADTPTEAGGNGSQRVWMDYRLTDHIKNYWYDINNQPVPKGWRLPNGKDVYSIMPEDNFHWFYDGRRFRQVGVGTWVEDTSKSGPRTTTGTAKQYCGEYKYQYFYGSFEVNKSATGNYSAPLYNDNNITRVYGIKYQGTSKAYRYMIEVHQSNIHNCGFARFSMFPATASDKFLCDKTGKDAISTSDNSYNLYDQSPKWNLHKFDWDHPSAYIDFPLQGQMEYHPMHLNIFGRDLKLRLMEMQSSTDNYCMKLSNAGTGFYGTWHSTTCSTRLVRDI